MSAIKTEKMAVHKKKAAGSDRTIVVTGATGHIGNVLVRELLARGHKKIRVLVLPHENALPLKGLEVEKVEGDLRDPASLIKAFEGADVVYHLAAIVSILPWRSRSLHEINVSGTRNVIEACRKTNVRRLVYTSSIHALFAEPPPKVVDENILFNPDNVVGAYAKSKAEASLEVLNAAKQGLDAVIVCPTGVIGPYDYKESEMGHLIKDFITGKLKVYIDGNQDFADVRDAAIGHILACEKGRRGEVYILSGETISIKNLLLLLEELTSLKAPSLKIPIPLVKIIAIFTSLYYILTKTKPRLTPYSIYVLTYKAFASDEKARRELGYSTRPLRKSIEDSVKWFKENRML